MTGVLAGIVHETAGGVYSVVLEDGSRVEASLRGRLKQEQRTGSRVVIGDRVTVSDSDESRTIESVELRATELVRRGRGRREAKILAANLDRVFAVVALRAPEATTQLIDRILVLVESSGMRPILVLNKADLAGAVEAAGPFAEVYEGIGYRVVTTSTKDRTGLAALHQEICSGSSAFIGPSGVGKSSLLNAIAPELALKTGELSKKTGTGRHTTVGSRLLSLECGGVVADTPGFGDVGLWDVPPDMIAGCFPEFGELAIDCRFRACSHLHEPDCGVQAALEAGRVHPTRYASYRSLHAEAKEAAQR